VSFQFMVLEAEHLATSSISCTDWTVCVHGHGALMVLPSINVLTLLMDKAIICL